MANKKKRHYAKKGFKLYPLKKETQIGGVKYPVGHKIPLNESGYRFYKRKKIV